MANRQRAEARRKAQAKVARQTGDGGGGRGFVWIAIAVVVVLGGGIAFFATRGDDKNSTVTADTNPFTGLPVSQPVSVTGDVLVPYDGQATSDAAIGKTAPVIAGLDFQGDPVVVDGTKGGPYMVVFLAHWCPHCNAEVPRLLAWKTQGGVPANLHIVGVATAVSSSAPNYPPAQWFSNKGWSWPVMVDQSQGDATAGVAATAFGATGWPYFVIVGTDGKVKARVSGEVSIADLQKIVDAAIAA